MRHITAKYVKDIEVKDPDTGNTIGLEVFKDPESGAMFAIDASYTEMVSEEIPSPFNKGTMLNLRIDVANSI